MSSKRIPLWKFTPSKNDRILMDTNILIKLFHPINYTDTKEEYGVFYSSLRSVKSTLLISSVQMSEYINRCIRLQFELFKNENEHAQYYKFKEDYRQTKDYVDSMNAILDTVKADIIPYFTPISDGFDNIDPEHIYLNKISYDFNDALLAEIAKEQKAILVTDDADFIYHMDDIDIVTSNKFLLTIK